MWPPAIVKVEVTADRVPGLADAFVSPQIHLLIFDAAPQALDEDIIPPSPFAVHADGNVVIGEHTGAGRARREEAGRSPAGRLTCGGKPHARQRCSLGGSQ